MPFLTEPGVHFSRIELSYLPRWFAAGLFNLEEPFEYVFLGETFIIDYRKQTITRVRTNETKPIIIDKDGLYFSPYKL